MAISRKQSKAELATLWERRIKAADEAFNKWVTRFKVDILYQYYEGYQWLTETDESNRPYVVNLIYSTIETKLPNLIYDHPQFNLTPRAVGDNWDFDKSAKTAAMKEDALNFICERNEFGLTDKHELAVLDAFFGFGVLHCDYDESPACNPYVKMNSKNKGNPLDKLFVKHVPFDTVRVSANANWDLSKGRWIGYFEWVDNSRLTDYEDKLNLNSQAYSEDDEIGYADNSGKISVGTDTNNQTKVGPSNHTLLWYLWDLATMKYCTYAPSVLAGNRILEYETFEHNPLSTLRFGKRRKGWYPYPPVWNWISPQDEINDVAQTQRVHRKRFKRAYQILQNSVDQIELDKFLDGPDGVTFTVKKIDAIKAVENPPMDPASVQSLARSYDDLNRISGSSSERQQVADRTTATQATLMDQAAQIREAKDTQRVGDFMDEFARSVLRALRNADGPIWILIKNRDENILGELKRVNAQWRKVPRTLLDGEDYDVAVNLSSVSPVAQNQDKKSFMEFLALLTQYQILAFSPALIREAAYRSGYKNSAVLNEFQQFAQLQSLGKMLELKQQVGSLSNPQAPQGPQPSQPGQAAQQQIASSTPPMNEEIMNAIFNRMPGQPQQ